MYNVLVFCLFHKRTHFITHHRLINMYLQADLQFDKWSVPSRMLAVWPAISIVYTKLVLKEMVFRNAVADVSFTETAEKHLNAFRGSTWVNYCRLQATTNLICEHESMKGVIRLEEFVYGVGWPSSNPSKSNLVGWLINFEWALRKTRSNMRLIAQ